MNIPKGYYLETTLYARGYDITFKRMGMTAEEASFYVSLTKLFTKDGDIYKNELFDEELSDYMDAFIDTHLSKGGKVPDEFLRDRSEGFEEYFYEDLLGDFMGSGDDRAPVYGYHLYHIPTEIKDITVNFR